MSPAADFGRLLELTLPGGGWALAISEVFFAESIEQQGNTRMLCVAGYVFRRSKAREFSRIWGNYLRRQGLPYFHMTDCAAREGVFKGWERGECDAVARELIRLTKRFSAFGFAIAINEDDYNELIGPQEGMRSAYAFALLAGMHHVLRWRQRANVSGPTSFFFESGHQHEGDANEWLRWMLGSPHLRDGLGYTGTHAFIPKSNPALHPADNLSWHWRLETVRRKDPNRKFGTRQDLLELWRATDVLAEYTRDRLMELKHYIETRAEKRNKFVRALLAARESATPLHLR